MLSFKKKANKQFSNYTCEYYLNNALRYLLKEEKPNTDAIFEICYCLMQADGNIFDDVKRTLTENGITPPMRHSN